MTKKQIARDILRKIRMAANKQAESSENIPAFERWRQFLNSDLAEHLAYQAVLDIPHFILNKSGLCYVYVLKRLSAGYRKYVGK